jgi:NAD+ diphosphatase
MIAFVADYDGGGIVTDGTEVVSAGWFRRDNLPSVPPKLSIARSLIDWWVENGTRPDSC